MTYDPYTAAPRDERKPPPNYGNKTYSNDPYGDRKPAAVAINSYGIASPSISTTTTTDASSYDPYAKYDKMQSNSTSAASTQHTSSYGVSSSGYNSYGTTAASGISEVSSSDYDPYAKYHNAPSTAVASTTKATAPSLSAATASSYGVSSSGYNSYGNTAASSNNNTVSDSNYDPYAKYDNAPSATAATSSSGNTVSDDPYSKYDNAPTTGVASAASGDSNSNTVLASNYDPYSQYDNATPATATAPTNATSSASPTSMTPGYNPYDGYDNPPSTTTATPMSLPATTPDSTLAATQASFQKLTTSTQSDDGFATGFHNPNFVGGNHHTAGTTASPTDIPAGAPAVAPVYIQVIIPEGVSSGQTIRVQAPDGRTKDVVVPQGMGPGSTFTTEFNGPTATGATSATTNPMASGSNNPHLVPIAPQHATRQPTEMNLKEKTLSWTGDDAKIKDSNGNVLFQVKGKIISFNEKRTIMDAQGNPIGTLKEKKFDLKPTIYIGTLNDEKKVVLKTSGMFNPLNSNASISINGQKVGKAKGNWRAKKFSIEIDGAVIATVGRKTTMAGIFMDADSYTISVTPPNGQAVDLAFVALLVLGLDELYHDK